MVGRLHERAFATLWTSGGLQLSFGAERASLTMKRALLVACAAILFPVGPAAAQIGGGTVFCINCADEPTANLSFGEQLIQAAKQLEQLTHEFNTDISTATMLTNQVINMASLKSTGFNGISPLITNLMKLMHAGSILESNTKYMLGTLGNHGGYPDMDLAGMQWQVSSDLSALASAMTAAGQLIDGQQIASARQNAAIEEQQDFSSGADGVKGALQANTAIAATNAQTLSMQNNASLAVLQAISTAETTRIDQEAANEAASRNGMTLAWAASCAGIQTEAWYCHDGAIINGASGGQTGAGGTLPNGGNIAAAGNALGGVLALPGNVAGAIDNLGNLFGGGNEDFSGGGNGGGDVVAVNLDG